MDHSFFIGVGLPSLRTRSHLINDRGFLYFSLVTTFLILKPNSTSSRLWSDLWPQRTYSLITSGLMIPFSRASINKPANWALMVVFSLTSSGKAMAIHFVVFYPNSPGASSLAWVRHMRLLRVSIAVPSSAYSPLSSSSQSTHIKPVSIARCTSANRNPGSRLHNTLKIVVSILVFFSFAVNHLFLTLPLQRYPLYLGNLGPLLQVSEFTRHLKSVHLVPVHRPVRLNIRLVLVHPNFSKRPKKRDTPKKSSYRQTNKKFY